MAGEQRKTHPKSQSTIPSGRPACGAVSEKARKKQWATLTLALLAIFVAPGCLSCFHCVPTPTHEELIARRAIPAQGRDAVHLFIINGLDPLDASHLTGLREYLAAAGFEKSYYGQLYHGGQFRREIQQLKQADPDVKIAILGYDMGAEVAHSLAQELGQDGIEVDLLAFLSPLELSDGLPNGDLPPTTRRVINLVGQPTLWDAPEPAVSETFRIEDAGHIGLPTHPLTRQILVRELTEIAAEVPVIIPHPGPVPPLVEPAPPPRPLLEEGAPAYGSAAPEEWNFLEPRPFAGAISSPNS